jgi:HSP20 family protein
MFRSLFPIARRASERFDPFFALQRDMGRLFENDFRDVAGPAVLAPSMDIKETDKGIQVEAELPGVEEKDLQVTYNGGVLTIKGEKKAEKETEKSGYHLSERSYGSFVRSLSIDDVDANRIEASFKNGVLKVMLPRQATAATKTIEVKASK